MFTAKKKDFRLYCNPYFYKNVSGVVFVVQQNSAPLLSDVVGLTNS